MTTPLRVAVAGVGGIGKHHAKWYSQWGCEVVAFTGTTPARCDRAAETLADLFGFAGRSYTDLGILLAEERPHIVDVCTPNEQHLAFAAEALRAGCHVLCEKPLTWQPQDVEHLHEAERLVQLARDMNLTFAVSTQYAAAIPHYDQLFRMSAAGPAEVMELSVEMETLSRGRVRDSREIWSDLGPHPLSLLLSWMPEGWIDHATLEAEFESRQVEVRFDFQAGKNRCHCHLVVRDIESGSPRRRFGINGFIVDVAGRNGENGVYEAVLRHGEQEVVCPDFMSLLIRQFIETVKGEEPAPLVPASLGIRNMELQLQILNACR